MKYTARDENILDLRRRGLSYSAISELFDLTKHRIRQIVRRDAPDLVLARNRFAKRNKLIIAARREGITYLNIGRDFGISREAAFSAVKRSAPELVQEREVKVVPYTKEEKQTITRLHTRGLSFGQIASRMDRTRNSIAGYCRRNGLRSAA